MAVSKCPCLTLKVIPLFCTAQPPLRITLRHPRWRRFFPLARKEGRFCRAKAFIRNNNATHRLKASWLAIEKQENERNVRDSEVCSGFSLRGRLVVELLKCPGCEACGTALRLSNCINEPVSGLGSLLYVCCSNSESGEMNISGTNKTHRGTRTTRGRPVFDVNTKFEFTFCCV